MQITSLSATYVTSHLNDYVLKSYAFMIQYYDIAIRYSLTSANITMLALVAVASYENVLLVSFDILETIIKTVLLNCSFMPCE